MSYTEQDYCTYIQTQISEYKEEYSHLISETNNELLQDNYASDLENNIYQLYLKAQARGISKENLDILFSEYDF